MREAVREGVELEEASGIQISGVTWWGTRHENGAGVVGVGGVRQGSEESEQPTTSAQPPTFI